MSEDERPKIIIDEDWKSQVETEREQLKQTADDEPASSGEASGSSSAVAGQTAGTEGEMEIPPASFQFLVSSIATQVMFAMGQIPDPNSGQAMVDLELAKHHIDMLSILDEKTKGNLSTEEGNMLTEALHQLRMGFVAVQEHVMAQQAGQQPPPQ